MRNPTTKRFWLAGVALMLTGALGACSDQPMGIEEGYEVQMTEDDGTDNCVIIENQIFCKE